MEPQQGGMPDSFLVWVESVIERRSCGIGGKSVAKDSAPWRPALRVARFGRKRKTKGGGDNGFLHMTRAEAEPAIRHLAREWAGTLSADDRKQPSFYAFKTWATDKGHSNYFRFRAFAGADAVAELWFNDELGIPQG
jgi:hypothetical protein